MMAATWLGLTSNWDLYLVNHATEQESGKHTVSNEINGLKINFLFTLRH